MILMCETHSKDRATYGLRAVLEASRDCVECTDLRIRNN